MNGPIRANERAAIAGPAFPYEIPTLGPFIPRQPKVLESFPCLQPVFQEIYATPKWTREGRWTADGKLLNHRDEVIFES